MNHPSNTSTHQPAPPRAATLRSPTLVAALAAVFIGAVDLTIIATILPTMIGDLNINTADLDRYIWIVNGYLIAYIVAIPLFGRLSDLVGRMPVFAVSLALFAAGSMVCALADTLPTMIAGRTLQGAGGGALLPAALALVADRFTGQNRLRVVGVVTAADTLGWVTGPLWGAAIVALFPGVAEAWRWVFWLHIPFALLCAAALLINREPSRVAGRRDPRRLDVVGAILLAAALVVLNLAFSSGGELGLAGGTGLRALGGTPNPLAGYTTALLGGAIICIAALVALQRRAQAPVLPVRLFRVRSFTATVVANVLLGAVLMVGMVNVPVLVALLVESEAVSRVSALMLAPFTLAIAVGSLASGRVAGRLAGRAGPTLGALLVVTGYALVAALLSPERYASIVVGLLVGGLGLGLVLAPLSGTALAVASAAERGAAASMALMARLLGMTIGISVLTSVGVRRLQTLTERVEPIARGTGESTAAFLDRQRQYIETYAIPLSVQVVGETFWIAAVIAALALVPVWLSREPEPYRAGSAERSAPSASATDWRSL